MDPVDNVANVPVHAAEAGPYQATGLGDRVLSTGGDVSQENSSKHFTPCHCSCAKGVFFALTDISPTRPSCNWGLMKPALPLILNPV
jgi:hypothetical protein